MGCIAGEESIVKRQNIDILRLSVEEWKRVQTFENLLDVSTYIFFNCSFIPTWSVRLPTRPNKNSPLPQFLRYVTRSPLSRNFTQPGRSSVHCRKQNLLNMPSMRQWQKSMNTIWKQQILMRILWPCVQTTFFFVDIFSQYTVLHPKRKMRYFMKNWSAPLQKEVATMSEKIVSQYNLLFFLI